MLQEALLVVAEQEPEALPALRAAAVASPVVGEPPVVAVVPRAAVALPVVGAVAPEFAPAARQEFVAGEREAPAYHPEDHRPRPAVCLPAATLAAVTLVAVTRQKD